MTEIQKKILLGCAFAATLMIVVYLLYRYMTTRNSQYNANREHTADHSGHGEPGRSAVVHLFFATWCPHCVRAKPEWDQAKDELNGTTVNGHRITFVEHDCSAESAETISITKEYGVEGYPTIKMNRQGSIIAFDGRVSAANIVAFVKAMA